jgi:hypothetical protein
MKKGRIHSMTRGTSSAEGMESCQPNLSELRSGVHNLIVLRTDDNNVEIDWTRFEQQASSSLRKQRL